MLIRISVGKKYFNCHYYYLRKGEKEGEIEREERKTKEDLKYFQKNFNN